MKDASGIRSNLQIGMDMSNSYESVGGIIGEVLLQCYDENGDLRWEEIRKNLITTTGDQYYAKQGAQGVGGNSAPSLVNGMKLGSSGTAAAKSGTGSTIVSGGYISNSNVSFSAVSVAASAGTDTGWTITYTASWPAGTATNSNIQEVAIVTDQATNAAPPASACVSRAVISPSRNKQSGDTLVATWTHNFLGA